MNLAESWGRCRGLLRIVAYWWLVDDRSRSARLWTWAGTSTHGKVYLKLNTKSLILLGFFGRLSGKHWISFTMSVRLSPEGTYVLWSPLVQVCFCFFRGLPSGYCGQITCEIKELVVPVVYVPPWAPWGRLWKLPGLKSGPWDITYSPESLAGSDWIYSLGFCLKLCPYLAASSFSSVSHSTY